MNRRAAFIRAILSNARFACGFVFIVCVYLATTGNSLAQVQLPEPPLPIDPRPIDQLLSQTEKASLAEAQGHGSRKAVEAYLKISDAHLQAAFNAISVNNHDAAERELDIYNKALAEAGKETFALKDGRRSLSKKIEQTLYRQIKTLESIDRLFPSEREGFAEAALKHAKQLRVQALNEAFASGGVLKDAEEEKKPKSEPPIKDSEPKNLDSAQPFKLREAELAAGETLQFDSPLGSEVCRILAASTTLPPDAFQSFVVRIGRNSVFLPKRIGWQIPGDYLTEEEDDHVREAQAAEARVKVFMKIADRRIKAIAGQAATLPDKKDQKKAEEEEREWGMLPKASRAELLRHYAKAIAECMAKLEDAYERNPKSASLPKALTFLRDATDRHLQTLRTLAVDMKNEGETSALRDAIDEAETANKGARDGLSKH